ncbi:MAG: nitrophenyl compound nitroreductase subunit ArsF family protein [Elusimicrobiota bacterium]
MKKLFLAILIIVAVASAGPISFAVENAPNNKVVVYYFHGTFRCPTCHKLEQYSKEAIETSFKDALRSGKLEYKVVNVEHKGNEHYTSDYQLYTKSLVLSLVKDGKETKWKNLEKIWEYVGNKQKFVDYVKTGVSDFLKEVE